MTTAIHAAKHVPPIDYTGVPLSYQGKCSAICRSALECRELVKWFGSADFCPNLPVLVLIPGSAAPIAIAGMGYATAAELQDCAIVTWHEKSARLAEGGTLLDFDEARERSGMMRREDVDTATREALVKRIARHKANPISDPARVPKHPNPTGRTLFTVKGEPS